MAHPHIRFCKQSLSFSFLQCLIVNFSLSTRDYVVIFNKNIGFGSKTERGLEVGKLSKYVITICRKFFLLLLLTESFIQDFFFNKNMIKILAGIFSKLFFAAGSQ
jgi:hypothetical protein